MFQPLKKGAKDTINKLHDDGHDISFVSLRGKKTSDRSSQLSEFTRLKIVPFLTTLQLKLNNVKYKQLKLVQNNEEKLSFIKSLRPNYVFEDQPSLINDIDESIHTVCINCNHNINDEITRDTIRINGYENGEVYNMLANQIEANEKSVTQSKCPRVLKLRFYKKMLTESVYVLVRQALKGRFAEKFQPLVCGEENIPDDKCSVVFVANHRNKLDPVMMSLVIKKPTHWAALLRMFQGKENLFNLSRNPMQCWLSAGFITAMGAVPIARPTDENFAEINTKSFDELAQYLQWNGAVGIYPEGTINRKPENQNVLPLKSIRSFRLAVENSAWIQPVSVVWIPKEVKIPNRVALMFDSPIHTNNMNAMEASELWTNITNLNIEKMKELVQHLKEIQVKECDEEIKETEKQLALSLFKNSFSHRH